MLIFRNLRDSLGIATLARQMYPKNVDCLLESYKDGKQPLIFLFVITRWGTCAQASIGFGFVESWIVVDSQKAEY